MFDFLKKAKIPPEAEQFVKENYTDVVTVINKMAQELPEDCPEDLTKWLSSLYVGNPAAMRIASKLALIFLKNKIFK